ncbi:retrotransposon nucleocapsid related protein [Cyclospora cayetanensis]|uniref:Retrotransposon nucleocapsid related protein n=1 Tax=Cyclospora cayetanensis TaxID=88456 RepID=A0A1D3CS00_9EIME|nr:retrotransposon nucleocapsid related protein [Cyclospora cayetanensis]
MLKQVVEKAKYCILLHCSLTSAHTYPFAWSEFLPCAEWVCLTTALLAVCSTKSQVHTDEPIPDANLDFVIQNEQPPSAAQGLRLQLTSARKRSRKHQERQARRYEKQQWAVSFDAGDLDLLDGQDPHGARQGDQTKWFAAM